MNRNWILITAVAGVTGLGFGQNAPLPAYERIPGLTLTTTAWQDGGIVPNRYTEVASPAAPVSPPLHWTHIPEGTVSFVLEERDQDVALNRRLDAVNQWTMFNIPGTATELPDGVANVAKLPDGSIQIRNQHNSIGYLPMGAPAVGPYHHYTFSLYALDINLSLGPNATAAEVDAAMQGHVLGKGVLVGRFQKP